MVQGNWPSPRENRAPMIRYRSQKQRPLDGFEMPFQVALDPGNRWVKLSECIPWDDLAEGYYAQRTSTRGRPTKDARLIIGAVIITCMPRLIEGYSSGELPVVGWLLPGEGLPGVAARTTDDGLITVSSLNVVIYGLLIAVFLLVEQRGLAGIWVRIRNYFSTWPFSY